MRDCTPQVALGMNRENLTLSPGHECPLHAREKSLLEQHPTFPSAGCSPTTNQQSKHLNSRASLPFPLVRMGLAAPRKYFPVHNLSIRPTTANQPTAKLKFPPTPGTPTGPVTPLISVIGYLNPTVGLPVLPLAIPPPLTIPVDTSPRRRTRA